MPTLYELANELQPIADALAVWALEHDDDVSEFPLLDRLIEIEGEMEAKCLSIAAWVKNLRSDAKAHAEEKKVQEGMRKAHQGKADRLEAFLEQHVPANAKWKDARASLSWKRNPPAVEVLAEIGLIPEKYLKPREVDKEKLKEDMLPFTLELPGPDGEMVRETRMQVRWPVDGSEVVLAELRQGASLQIK